MMKHNSTCIFFFIYKSSWIYHFIKFYIIKLNKWQDYGKLNVKILEYIKYNTILKHKKLSNGILFSLWMEKKFPVESLLQNTWGKKKKNKIPENLFLTLQNHYGWLLMNQQIVPCWYHIQFHFILLFNSWSSLNAWSNKIHNICIKCLS